MNLEDVYASRVSSNSRPSVMGMVSDFERDPLFVNLENQVFSMLKNVNDLDSKEKKEDYKEKVYSNGVTFNCGFEDAIKELIKIKNNKNYFTK